MKRRRRDVMSREKRSALMSRIRGKNTGPEKIVERYLRKAGIRFRRQVSSLPGRPDFIIPESNLALFVDGDFWHGWRFPAWEKKLSSFWKKKIGDNRVRDARNFRKLRRASWKVVRIWEHQLVKQAHKTLQKLPI